MKISSEEFEELIISFAPIIRSISRKYYLIGGTEDDLFQEGLIGLFEACKNYNIDDDYKSEKFKSFAIMCVKRQIYDAIKSANKKKNQPLNNYVPIIKTNSENQEYERTDFVNLAEDNNPEDLFLDKEEHAEKIELIKSKLSDFEIEVLNHYLAGEKQSEIAKALGKNAKSIDNTIQRIKNKVK